MQTKTASFGEMTIDVEIEGSIDAVWKALVDDIGEWWPDEFFAGGAAGTRRYLLEARPGGRMWEEWESGGGLIWGTVVTIDPPTKLQVVGHTFPEWGGPGTWYATWELEERDSGVILRFSEATVGKVSEAGMESKRKGWTYLFESAMRAHVEGKPTPPWSDE